MNAALTPLTHAAMTPITFAALTPITCAAKNPLTNAALTTLLHAANPNLNAAKHPMTFAALHPQPRSALPPPLPLPLPPPPPQHRGAIATIQTWTVHYAPIATPAAERTVVLSRIAARNGHVCTLKRASKPVTTSLTVSIAKLALTLILIPESAAKMGLGMVSRQSFMEFFA